MKKLIAIFAILSMVFGIAAFQCSSTELTSAKLYIQQKNLDRALDVLQKEVEKNPQSDEGYYLLGYVHGEKGNLEKMLENFEKSLAISNKFATEIDNSKSYHWANSFNQGVAYFNRAGKATTADSVDMFYDKAINSFQTAISCQPDSAATYHNLVYAYISRGQYDEAIEPLEKILSLEHSADAYSRLGEIYYNKGVTKMDDFKLSKDVADSTSAIGFFDQAIEVLKEGRKEFPLDENISIFLFNSYVGSGKEDVALEAAKELVEKTPNSKQNRYNYGSLLLNAGNYEGAEEQFLAAVELDPEYTNAIYNLSVTYVRWGAEIRDEAEAAGQESEEYKEKFQKALPYLENYSKTEAGSTEPAIWDLLGKIYANLGMTDESMEAFDKADKLR